MPSKVVSTLFLASLLALSPGANLPAVANAEKSWMQESNKDSVDKDFSVSREWDLDSFKLQLHHGFQEAQMYLWIETIGTVTFEPWQENYFIINIDTNRDQKADYYLSTQGISLMRSPFGGSEDVMGLKFKPIEGQRELDCSVLLSREDNEVYLNLNNGTCLKIFPRFGIQIQSVGRSGVLDSVPPGGSKFLQVTTNYYDGWKCNLASKGLQRTNLKDVRTKFSTCSLVNGSWVWVGSNKEVKYQGSKPTTTKTFKYLTEKAVWSCGLRSNYFATLRDGNRTLIIESGGLGLPSSALSCIFKQLKMPSWVRARVDSTRALDGEKTATWSGYKAFWTYHPDDGLNMTVTKK